MARKSRPRNRELVVPAYSLEELVSRITPENRHEEVDWGPAVGRERVDDLPGV
jgi:antitoxin component of MazEF toxin-antitoxin module